MDRLLPATRAHGAKIHPALEADDRRVIERSDGRMVRVSAPVAELWLALDGKSTSQQLVASLGSEWTEELVDQAIANLEHAFLLDISGGTTTGPVHKRLAWGPVEVASNGSLQLTLFRNIERVGLARGLARVFGGKPAACGAIILGVAGLVNMALNWSDFHAALTQPVSYSQLVAFFILAILTTTLHELGHAFRAISAGGRVRRIGIMLFYLSPAMFCDITDTWRLDRKARVTTALAGLAATTAMVGLLSLSFTLSGSNSAVLAALSVAMVLGLVVNSIPLVKYDGYIALMTYLDIPNLRVKAMRAWKDWCAAQIVGSNRRQEPRAPDQRQSWLVVYGVLASLGPIVLLSAVVDQFGKSMASMGLVGLIVRSLVGIGIAVLVARGAWHLWKAFREAGASIVRTGLVGMVIMAAAAGILLGCPVEERLTTAFFVSDEDEVVMVVPAALESRFHDGQTVDMARVGLLLTGAEATGRVTGLPHSRQVPIATLAPALKPTSGFVDMPAVVVHVESGQPAPGTVGAAYVRGETMSLGRFLFGLIVGDTVTSIVSQFN
jgi:putative peptide zinc metalloprotease protein